MSRDLTLMATLDGLRGALGVLRSLAIYYRPGRRALLDAMHRRFVGPGDLAFDLGAHVGDRVGSLRRLGARVVAVEPQPALVSALRLLYGRDAEVCIEPVAVGASDGETELFLNLPNPTVSTASADFIAAARAAPGWQGQRWQRRRWVPLVTLDTLIARHGEPRFCKIDVEGLEAAVLEGLSRPLPALSFGFTTIARDVALAALAHCERLGGYRYNAALGESGRLVHATWLDRGAITAWLLALPLAANSGDIYAWRDGDCSAGRAA